MNYVVVGRPDLIFIAGGTDGGSYSPVEHILHDIETGMKVLPEAQRPILLYAGNKKLQPIVTEIFGNLTTVLMSDNIRPSIDKEDFDSAHTALARAYDTHRETHGDAFVVVGEMSSTGLLPTAQSYDIVTQYFASTRNQNVIAIDMGSTSSVIAGAFNGETITRIHTNIGLGQSATTLVEEVGTDAIAQWLPFYPQASEIQNYALNKVSRPASIPMDLRDMFMEQAMMRAGVRHMVSESRRVWKGVNNVGLMPEIGLIVVGGGALNGTGNASYDMMLIADCIQPTGITDIKADRIGIIPAIDAVARTQPEAAVQILDGSNLEHLGTLISLEGQYKPDTLAVEIHLEESDEPIKLQAGQLVSLPIPEDFDLEIDLHCKNGFRVQGKRRLKLTLHGGTGGILIDTRGRNLEPSSTVEERMIVLPQWISSASDDELFELPDDWAVEPLDPSRTAVNLAGLRSDNKEFDFGEEPVKQSEFSIDDLFDSDDDDGDIFAEFDDDGDDFDLRSL